MKSTTYSQTCPFCDKKMSWISPILIQMQILNCRFYQFCPGFSECYQNITFYLLKSSCTQLIMFWFIGWCFTTVPLKPQTDQ